ncbi:MAG TPA: YggS family pyridoxal phosphate-dependent enzyme [Rhizomicrobium sp.]|nr:YggS family pyridoxal phosphate-dependent enzyme [Rhizomicrobium sp.]
MSPQAESLSRILARIEAARKAALKPAPFTRLIAVSKGHDADRIRPLLEAGQRDFGENRVQEAMAKWPALKADYKDARLHLIGPLQTNKAREAVEFFDAIHSLDRPKLADALAREMGRSGCAPQVLVQVNTGEEPQKAGVAPREAGSLIATARACGLPLKGLMCIPPADREPAPHFALLAEIARAHALCWLSMGMSADFETAIRFGATHVRVGTALFGERRRP